MDAPGRLCRRIFGSRALGQLAPAQIVLGFLVEHSLTPEHRDLSQIRVEYPQNVTAGL
jgi:hypothetical protein